MNINSTNSFRSVQSKLAASEPLNKSGLVKASNDDSLNLLQGQLHKAPEIPSPRKPLQGVGLDVLAIGAIAALDKIGFRAVERDELHPTSDTYEYFSKKIKELDQGNNNLFFVKALKPGQKVATGPDWESIPHFPVKRYIGIPGRSFSKGILPVGVTYNPIKEEKQLTIIVGTYDSIALRKITETNLVKS